MIVIRLQGKPSKTKGIQVYAPTANAEEDAGEWFYEDLQDLKLTPKKDVLFPLAAKSLQLCPTLCDPIDGSPPGSPIPEILQARTLEWVAISFSNSWKWKVKVKSLSRVRLFATPWTAAYQAPPSMRFSRQEYWSGMPLPSPLFLLADQKAKHGSQEDLEKSSLALVYKWSRAKANRILPRECIVIANTLFQKHKRRLYTWTSPNSQYWNQTDCILCSWKWRNSV